MKKRFPKSRSKLYEVATPRRPGVPVSQRGRKKAGFVVGDIYRTMFPK